MLRSPTDRVGIYHDMILVEKWRVVTYDPNTQMARIRCSKTGETKLVSAGQIADNFEEMPRAENRFVRQVRCPWKIGAALPFITQQDLDTIKQVNEDYRWLDFVGSHVVDIGSHKGYFWHMALSKGAARCASYEVSGLNVGFHRHHFLHDDSPQVTHAYIGEIYMLDHPKIYRRPDDSTCDMISSVRRDGWEEREVRNNIPRLTLREVLGQNEGVTILKIDIEGGEFALDYSELPESLTQIAIEFHFFHHEQVGSPLHSQMLDILGYFGTCGFKLVSNKDILERRKLERFIPCVLKR